MRDVKARTTLSVIVAIAALFAMSSPAPASAGSFDEATTGYLEGLWLIGEHPDKGECLSHPYRADQLEFEFRKSGGRVLRFEPPDLFTGIAITDVREEGDHVRLTARARDGDRQPFMALRLLKPDRLELLRKTGESEDAPQFAYRCGRPNLSVTKSAPAAALSLLTPDLSGSQGFPEIRSGENERAVCNGRGPKPPDQTRRRWLQFELIGPAHYWVFGQGFGSKRPLDFDIVRSVRELDPHTVRLQMQERAKIGQEWDPPGGWGRRYRLTVIDKGGTIVIPELSASFVRCNADEVGSLGMGRW